MSEHKCTACGKVIHGTEIYGETYQEMCWNCHSALMDESPQIVALKSVVDWWLQPARPHRNTPGVAFNPFRKERKEWYLRGGRKY